MVGFHAFLAAVCRGRSGDGRIGCAERGASWDGGPVGSGHDCTVHALADLASQGSDTD